MSKARVETWIDPETGETLARPVSALKREEAETKALEYLTREGHFKVGAIKRLTDLILSVGEERGRFNYPHMCRDEHEEIGFRWDKELCPVCDARGEAARVVREVKRTPMFRTAGVLACDEILRRLGLEGD